MNEAKRCSALTRTGRACRAWAVRGSNPPRCHAHRDNEDASGREPGPEGMVSSLLAGQELVNYPDRPGGGLQNDIRMVRFILDRLRNEIGTDPDPDDDRLEKLAPLVFAGMRTISQLMRDQHTLSGGGDNELTELIAQAREELGMEWGIEL